MNKQIGKGTDMKSINYKARIRCYNVRMKNKRYSFNKNKNL